MEYDLNLNRDEMNHFRLKLNPSRCEHVVRRGPRLKLKQKGEDKVENKIFCCCVRVRVREERNRRAKGFFSRSTEFCRVKNKSSSHRRGLCVGTKNTGFHRGSKRGVREIKGFGFGKFPQGFLGFLLRSKR